MKKLLLPIFIFTLIIYFLTSAGNTPYDYFTRLADAFLHGRSYITENPPWLNELIPAGENKFYVVYSPMPAIISIPFVLLFGTSFPQQYIAHLVGAGIVVLTAKLAYLFKKDKKFALWAASLVGFGSIIWFLSAGGSSWYLGQITATFFLLAALVESFGKKRFFIIGIFLGAAYLSRLHTILSLPLYIFLLKDGLKNKGFVNLLLGILPFIFFYAAYNFLRYGVLWDKGYVLIPGLLEEPWYQKGLFHPSYISRHLKIIFGALPIIQNTPPFLIPSWKGLAIWVTTPAFIYSLKAPLKKHEVKLSWFTSLLIAIVVFSHGTTGFAQFGYRFAVDFYPFLIFLLIISLSKKKLKWHHWALLIISILVNLWGVIWINKFGWVSF